MATETERPVTYREFREFAESVDGRFNVMEKTLARMDGKLNLICAALNIDPEQ